MKVHITPQSAAPVSTTSSDGGARSRVGLMAIIRHIRIIRIIRIIRNIIIIRPDGDYYDDGAHGPLHGDQNHEDQLQIYEVEPTQRCCSECPQDLLRRH